MNLIPFDLERAKKGVPMKTRDDQKAVFVALLNGGQPSPLVVEIHPEDPDKDDFWDDELEEYIGWEPAVPFLENYYIDGRHGTVHDSPLDLFMEY
jgi:hypothetical protein